MGCRPGDYPVEVRTHTALHVLKGAVVRVLGPGSKWTASTYVRGGHGRLVVTAEHRPSGEELRRIEELANRLVEADVPVRVEVLPRRVAEERYGDEVYDLFPVPEGVEELSIVVIPDPWGPGFWNVNACNKQHTRSTGCVGSLRLGRPRFRRTRGLLELPFDLVEA